MLNRVLPRSVDVASIKRYHSLSAVKESRLIVFINYDGSGEDRTILIRV